MNEQLFNIKFTKINAIFKLLGARLTNSFEEFYHSSLKCGKIGFLFSGVNTITNRIILTMLIFYGGFEIINNRLSIGQLTILNAYFSALLYSISYFMNVGKEYQTAKVSYNRINDLYKIKIEHNGTKELERIERITLDNLNFKYVENNKLVYNFSYTFEKNNVYCIIGKNGIGKSTLTNLIIGLLTDYTGSILYNSINIKEINMYSLREKLIGVSEQEPILFNDTIKNNLALGSENIDNKLMNEWCEKFNIYELIMSLDKGYETMLDQYSSNLSGGEKQKISLSRVFIKKPDVIILDEPTSALDRKTIEKFKSIIKEYKKDKIIIIITHEPELESIADHIINL